MEESAIDRDMTCSVEGMENLYDTLQQQQHQQESVKDGNMTGSAEGMEMVCVLPQQHQHQQMDENEPSQTEDGSDDHHNKMIGSNREDDMVRQDRSDDHHKKMRWSNRLKWEDDTVKILIQVICSVDEEFNMSKVKDKDMCFRKHKWRYVSERMLEKGCRVSGNQCKDKFNDLYKKFKRLNDTLGGEDASKFVKNPALLDSVDCISKETKEEIRKILCSKQLFYEEVCSYDTANKLYEALFENGEDAAEDIARTENMESQWMRVQELSLNKRKVEIEAQAVELKKERFKWQKISSKKDKKLKMLELEIEKMKLENERMQMQLKQKELEIVSEAGVTSHDPGVGNRKDEA